MSAAIPFLIFLGFCGYFWLSARREGKDVRTWQRERNRHVLENLKPGWWHPIAAFALVAWVVMFVVSGLDLVVLAVLPVLALWVLFMVLVAPRLARWHARRD